MYFELQRGREKVRVNPDKELHLTIGFILFKPTSPWELRLSNFKKGAKAT